MKESGIALVERAADNIGSDEESVIDIISLNSTPKYSDSIPNIKYSFDLSQSIVDPESGGVTFNVEAKNLNKKLKETFKRLGSLDNFTTEIERYFFINRQTDETLRQKKRLAAKIESSLKVLASGSAIHMTGSSVTGLGSYNCDIDMCWNCYVSLYGEDRKREIHRMLKVAKQRIRKDFPEAVRSIDVIRAVVPILKFELAYFDEETHKDVCFEVDININNHPGIYNSKLLHYYSLFDRRFSQLVLVLKHWAQIREIKDAQNGFFNSYSIALLALHYLQCGVKPYVLPNLQKLYPQIFDDAESLIELEYRQHFESPITKESLTINRQPISELLIGFFDYYRNFDFDHYAISVREGKIIPRSQCSSDNPLTYCLFIEEPYDYKNTARCVTHQQNWAVIQTCFNDAYDSLVYPGGVTPSLSDIGIYM
uniref:PAP-associated domain-containing protein n=1 Tax=Strongyloides stercoralis TaxID=6248 RepID=A0AAF5DC59_STRER